MFASQSSKVVGAMSAAGSASRTSPTMDSALLAQHRVDHAVEVHAVSEVHRERVAAGFVQSGGGAESHR
ncbi:hypothetical protein ACFQS1_37305 [Paractinoplanes rhizophilus]|uniref:Uncharacterized protein n=1 Tax=Paractinoplanes rhizophilus TaxID=1416877 RepID=A0ABW2I4D0_9ACTN